VIKDGIYKVGVMDKADGSLCECKLEILQGSAFISWIEADGVEQKKQVNPVHLQAVNGFGGWDFFLSGPATDLDSL